MQDLIILQHDAFCCETKEGPDSVLQYLIIIQHFGVILGCDCSFHLLARHVVQSEVQVSHPKYIAGE